MWKVLPLFGVACLVVLPALARQPEPKVLDQGEPRKVEMKGKLHTGVVAIGGETTGTEIETKAGRYELDLRGDKELLKTAAKLDGKEVVVTGTLELRKGVEVKERRIITVVTLREAAEK